MLRSLKKDEYKAYLDWAYGLALDMSRSGYPTYADGLKTRAEFDEIAALAHEREHEGALLFEDGGKALGYIHYFALPEDEYLDTRAFCIEDKTEQAIDELLAYLAPKYPGFTMHFGFPEENVRAVNHLIELGWPLNEESLVAVMKFEEYEPKPESEKPIPITEENFDRFAALHAQWDGKMYWDNAHLREALDRWHIYLYHREDRDLASVYFIYVDGFLEIFGMDYAEDRFDREAVRAELQQHIEDKAVSLMRSFPDMEEREAGERALNSMGED